MGTKMSCSPSPLHFGKGPKEEESEGGVCTQDTNRQHLVMGEPANEIWQAMSCKRLKVSQSL